MCHNEIAFCDDDHTGLVVPTLGILLHQGAQARSLGGNKRVVLDVVGREPPLQRSEVAIGKSLSEEFADDDFVALRVVRHACLPRPSWATSRCRKQLTRWSLTIPTACMCA